jgi:protein phosphatase
MRLTIPDFALVMLIGVAGSGKSTFAARNFAPAEVLEDAGDAAARRLEARALAVLDARHLRAAERLACVRLARRFHAPPVAIALDVPEAECDARNRARDPQAPAVRGDAQMLRHALPGLAREGFGVVHVLSSVAEVERAAIAREPLA